MKCCTLFYSAIYYEINCFEKKKKTIPCYLCVLVCGVGVWMGKSIRLSVHDGDDSNNVGMQCTSEEDLISSVNFVRNHKEEKIGKC